MTRLGQKFFESAGSRQGKNPPECPACPGILIPAPNRGALTKKFLAALEKLQMTHSYPKEPWWGRLSPEVAMFGDLSPEISSDAAAILLAEYFNALTANSDDSGELSDHVSEIPAWTASSPWHNGLFAGARLFSMKSTLIRLRLRPASKAFWQNWACRRRTLVWANWGPRGVALAGGALKPTILINSDNPRNRKRGRRFTLAHELCHILFDRSHARPLAHSSTPWAPPAVEQRANAFAAMLLMPPKRANIPAGSCPADLKQTVERLADKLKVSRSALKRHLANINVIGADELEFLVGDQFYEL